MQGKVCLVTGATSGIGLAAATALAAQGAQLVIVGRRPARIQAALAQIRAATGNDTALALQADFSDLRQVAALADEFKASFTRLDVLVNNAGAYFNRRHATPYGIELTFLVNHLAPFLLTTRLLDILESSAPSRIVNVASASHWQADLDFDNLDFRRSYFGMKAYGRSKLANLLFTYELARRLPSDRVTVNALHPGWVATDIWRTNFPVVGLLFKWFTSLFALTPEQGADTVVYLASSPQVAGVTGKYFIERKATASSPLSVDQSLARQLWQESERIVGLALSG